MNCEKIQELILTDYTDDQMDPGHKKYLEDHLAQCPQCLEFAQVVKQSAVSPFEDIKRANPPERVWLNIQQSILAEEKVEVNFLTQWWNDLKSVTVFPRPALAFAMALIVFFVIGSLHQFKINKKINPKEQMEYLDSLANLPADFSVNDNNGYGTMVEQYFL